MLRQKAAIRVLSLILSLTFMCGQVFAGSEAYLSASKDTMAPSSVLDTDINPGRTEGFIKDIKPSQIGDGPTMLAIARGELPPRVDLEDWEIARLREAIRLAVILSSGYSKPEYKEIVKARIQNLINLNNKLVEKTYAYKLIANKPKDYSAGFGFILGFTGLTKELIGRLSIKDLAQYISHEVTPEDKIILAEIKNEEILKKIGNDDRRAHRLVYNEIDTYIYGQEAVERLGKEIRAAINEKLLPLAEAAIRTPIAVANWKMEIPDQNIAATLAGGIRAHVITHGYGPAEIIIAPSFIHLSAVREMLGRVSTLELAAQDVHFMEKGAFTGETSSIQLKNLGVSHIIIGHSERRRGEARESNELINKKTKTALKNGFSVILCIGEDLKEFEAGKTKQVIEDQIRNSLAGLTAEDRKNVIIAYEPVWAIGSGKVATPEQANNNQRYIRALLLDMFGFDTAATTRILYGGSVKPDNIKGLTIKPNVDGVLVGGASLKVGDFVSIGKTINDERSNKEKPAADQPSLTEVFRPWSANEPQHKVAINGFGRIGKLFFKAFLEKADNNFEIVAVNDLDKIENLAHLFRYDSTFGNFKGKVKVEGDNLIINGQRIKVLSEKDPAKLPWKDLGVETVLESSGRFTKRADANKHIEAGAKKVVISAPGEEEDLTVVLGVNQENYDPKTHHIISNASCTTNALAPVVKVLREKFGIQSGSMLTVHAATNDQNVLDTMHKDQRRARATLGNIIPTTTGAAKAIGKVIPDLKGRLDGLAMRVPTANVSAIYLDVVLKENATAKEVNTALKEAARQRPLSGYLGYTEDALVSGDFLRNPKSGTVDASLTKVTDKIASVVIWYDNEWGYSNRLVELVNYILGRTAPTAAGQPGTEAGKAKASSAATFAEFVEMAKAEAKALKIEAKGLGRIFVVGVSGSNASKAALEIGSTVGATRTLIPETGKVDIVELVRDLKSYYQKYGFGLLLVAHGAKIKKDETNEELFNEELFNTALKKDGAARAIYEMAKEKGVDKGGYLQFEKYADIVTAILSAELGKKEVGITVSQAGDIDYDTTVYGAVSNEKQAGIDRIDEEKYRKANAALFAEDEVKTIETVSGFDVFAPLKENTIRYGILTGGGLASGHNQVIAEAVREAYRQAEKSGKNIEIIGLKSGWAGLIKDKLVNRAHLLTLEEVEKYEKQGGSILGTSRTNPYSKENIDKGVPQILADNIKRLQLHGLITCGGDDTNGAAAKLQAQFPALSFIGVPKTMDNDIPLPGGAPNYGNRTFIEAGILRGQAYKKIAQQEKKIIVFEAFGRNSGFAALGVGAGIGATRTLVREEGVIDFDKVADEIEAFYNKNGYAVVCVAEGIKTDIKGNEAIFDAAFKIDPVAKAFYDDVKGKVDAFGHPKLKGAGRIITAILKAKLAYKGIVVEQKGNLDYGPRSADISSTDLKMTNTLGKAAITKLLEGKKDIILYVDNDGNAGEMDLQKELGGREADIKEGGANYRDYLSANRAFSQKAAVAQDVTELLGNIKDAARVTKDSVVITDRAKFVSETVDYLARESALNANPDIKRAASRLLMEAGENMGIHSSSMHGIYEARKAGKILQKVTVPANNIRGMAYDTMITGFDVMKKHDGFGIFEIARSEIGYTKQPLYEYSAQVYAAAIKSGYKGKIFIQLDHAQYDKEKYFGFKGKAADPDGARQDIVKLVDEAVDARVFNIDADPSSLMIAGNLKDKDATNPELKELELYDLEELSKEDAFESLADKEILLRQTFNIRETAYLVGYIRNLEKKLGLPLTIAIGGEDMHVDQNVLSTKRSVQLFAGALEEALNKFGIEEGKGVIKISVQSGTGHGGITIAGVPGDKSAVKIDMNTLKEITAAAETGKLGSTIAGVVQHGASTVPEEYFSAFSDNDVIEVHLATGFQNKQLEGIRKKSPALFQRLNESMVKSSLWTKEGKDGEIKKAIAKYIASYYKKAYGANIDDSLYQKLLGEAVTLVEGEKDWAAFTERVHQEVAGLAQFGGKIQKDDAMIMRFAIAEAFYRSYKKVFGLEKKALWDMGEAVKKEVYKAVAQNFTFIWMELGFKDTLKQADAYAPKVPLDVTLRPQALQDAAASIALAKPEQRPFEVPAIAGTTPVESTPVSIKEELPYRAEVFKANLLQILAEHRDQVFFIGIETDIGEDQKAQIMPVYKAIDEIEKMTDSAGKRLFPNLMVKRATANELVTIAGDLNKEGKLNLNNAFIGARKISVENKAYDTIAGEGRAWISAIDDSQSGDYLPVFEAITLNMMASVNADLAAIKSFYDAISDKPIDPGVLQDMIRKRIIFILPRVTKLDTKQLRELYELAQQIYVAA